MNFTPQPAGIHRENIGRRLPFFDVEADRQPAVIGIGRYNIPGSIQRITANVLPIEPFDPVNGHFLAKIDEAYGLKDIFLAIHGNIAQLALFETRSGGGKHQTAHQGDHGGEDNGFELIRHWAPVCSAAP